MMKNVTVIALLTNSREIAGNLFEMVTHEGEKVDALVVHLDTQILGRKNVEAAIENTFNRAAELEDSKLSNT